MAEPVRTNPRDDGRDEALEVLRRLEPTLTDLRTEQQRQAALLQDVQAEQKRQAAELTALKDEMAATRAQGDGRLTAAETRFHELEGRFQGIDGRLQGIDGRLQGLDGHLGTVGLVLRRVPSIWTQAVLVVVIMFLTIFMVRFGLP